jgi:hypothetical protein
MQFLQPTVTLRLFEYPTSHVKLNSSVALIIVNFGSDYYTVSL